MGRVFNDVRGSLRQGGCASMTWFSLGIDPLLRYLEKRLQGILVSSLPVLGPVLHGDKMPLPPLEERFKLMAYCDDVKPAVSTMLVLFLRSLLDVIFTETLHLKNVSCLHYEGGKAHSNRKTFP